MGRREGRRGAGRVNEGGVFGKICIPKVGTEALRIIEIGESPKVGEGRDHCKK